MTSRPKQCVECGNELGSGQHKCPVCGYSSVPPWIRLWHDSKFCLTFFENTTAVNRTIFHTAFSNVMTEKGIPIASFLPSDNSPLFTILRQETGWYVQGVSTTKNYLLMEGKRITADLQEITDGSRLGIYSIKEEKIIAFFLIKYETGT